jgi:hypothetical protein
MNDQHIIELFHRLSAHRQQQVQDFIEFLLSKQGNRNQAATTKPRRRGALGSLTGQVWMAPDFDAPLDDFRDYM